MDGNAGKRRGLFGVCEPGRSQSPHSVCWAARESGGLKSPRRSDEERRIRKRGVMPRWPGKQGGMEKPKQASGSTGEWLTPVPASRKGTGITRTSAAASGPWAGRRGVAPDACEAVARRKQTCARCSAIRHRSRLKTSAPTPANRINNPVIITCKRRIKR